MNPIPNPSWIDQLRKSAESFAGLPVAREHIALLQTAGDLAREERAAREQEVREGAQREASLLAQLAEAKKQLAAAVEQLESRARFTKHSGALFERGPEGRVDSVVHCPRCLYSTNARGPNYFFKCHTCQWESPFVASRLPKIVAELNGDPVPPDPAPPPEPVSHQSGWVMRGVRGPRW